jgi:hypothetical protein
MLSRAKVLAFWTLYEKQESIVDVVKRDPGDERSSLVGNVGETDRAECCGYDYLPESFPESAQLGCSNNVAT